VSDDFCDICGVVPRSLTRYYANHPFVDGRCYSLICWTCACIPKTEYIDENGKFVFLRNPDSEHLNSFEEMVYEDGFPRIDTDRSLKAVKKLLKCVKSNFESMHTAHIFAQLFFGDSVEMTLTL